MRGGLTAIQQTLTPEAASVLSHSISEAGRRNHGQTTPLHVAATLLASPTGFLRQACIRSHPNSSHPLQCRALELCFSVALDRLPTSSTTVTGNGQGQTVVLEPPISNALMAALKRAQAHQRRGCPEQQQPLLAVKVELEQLIVSILDDPSVSRVMREASFSSPAVKAAIEQQAALTGGGPGGGVSGGGGIRQRNMYLNPKLQNSGNHNQNLYDHVNGNVMNGNNNGEDVRKVVEILTRVKKRNPVLVGEAVPKEVVREVLGKIEKGEILKSVEVVSLERELGLDAMKVRELGGLIERKMGGGGVGVVVDLGDLKWLVDGNQGVSEAARVAVAEIGRLLRKFGEEGKVWFVGIATCETYLRCQVYHPTMETEWDLQVVSIVASRPSAMPGMLPLPRLGSNGGILSSSVECLSPMKNFPMTGPPPLMSRRVSENLDPLRRFTCCPQCTEKYGQELVKLNAELLEKLQSDDKSDGPFQSLPPWLQTAKTHSNDTIQSKDQEMILRQKTQELQKKWGETCLQLHPSFHHNVGSERIVPSPLSMTGLYNPALLSRQPFQPKMQQSRSLGESLQLNLSSSPMSQPLRSARRPSPPGSPVRTELALGRPKLMETSNNEQVKDFLGCISSEPQKNFQHSQGNINQPNTPIDIDSFKKLMKGLMEKVWWQREAASAVASTVTQCKSGNGNRRVGGSKGDIWLLFSGPDRIGKKKMAAGLSNLVYGVSPILISLGSRRDGDESDLNFRGKTAIDRIAEAVKRNPFSVMMLQDIDEADMLVRGSIKRAMERGRLTDSHGREISLGNVIFILTTSWAPEKLNGLSSGGLTLNEEKLTSLASGGWQLRISIGEKPSGKRSPSWLNEEDHDRNTKQRKEMGPGLSFDLNQMADNEDDRLDGSNNSSDLTVDHDEENAHDRRGSPTTSSPSRELLSFVDETIIFKPVDFAPIKENIERAILTKFSSILGDKLSLKIEREALQKILSGTWLGQTSVESWSEKVLVPSIHHLKTSLQSLFSSSTEGRLTALLELDKESESRNHGDWLPSRISVLADTQ